MQPTSKPNHQTPTHHPSTPQPPVPPKPTSNPKPISPSKLKPPHRTTRPATPPTSRPARTKDPAYPRKRHRKTSTPASQPLDTRHAPPSASHPSTNPTIRAEAPAFSTSALLPLPPANSTTAPPTAPASQPSIHPSTNPIIRTPAPASPTSATSPLPPTAPASQPLDTRHAPPSASLPSIHPSINPTIRAPAPTPQPRVWLVTLAQELAIHRVTALRLAQRLGFTPRVGPERCPKTGHYLATISAAEADQLRAHVRDGRPGRTDGDCNQNRTPTRRGAGYFYLIQLEPDHDPTRLKLGFSSDLPTRLSKHRGTSPFSLILKAWPCLRQWEFTAMAWITRDSERLGPELFRHPNPLILLARAETFFAYMPQILP